jgi:hypothetical protein
VLDCQGFTPLEVKGYNYFAVLWSQECICIVDAESKISAKGGGFIKVLNVCLLQK